MPTELLKQRMGIKEFLGDYGTQAKFPEISGTYSGNVVICADAQCVWDDLERFGCKSTINRGRVFKLGWQFMTVNKMVETLPGDIEHCYSNEPNTLLRFIAARRTEYKREFSPVKNSHSITKGVMWEWPFGGHGTSGLGSCLVAVALGYQRIVLCGMPLDDGPHNGEPPWRKTNFNSSEAAGPEIKDSSITGEDSHWKKARQVAFEGKVKSMSGRTKDWLGDALPWA